MKTLDFDYQFPEQLIATEPQRTFRALMQLLGDRSSEPYEENKPQLLNHLKAGDVLVINDTKVERRRVTTEKGLEILFLAALDATHKSWQVLCPARELKDGEKIALPGGVTAELKARGLPQSLEVDQPINEQYFTQYGELALPPYIQKARGERKNRAEEDQWYQTAWARYSGSQAAPTASLHFTKDDMIYLTRRGVIVAPLTLHVGMGTFLPVKTENLEDHQMHSEFVHIPSTTIEQFIAAKRSGQKVWAMGTTVARALESWALGQIPETFGGCSGETKLFIKPGHRFEVVDTLLTNFHQPKSTLLALVCAFAGRETVMKAYQWAIMKRFKLFSYGHLTAWVKP